MTITRTETSAAKVRAARVSSPARGPALAMAVFTVLAPQLLGGATPTTELLIDVAGLAVCVYAVLALRHEMRSLGVLPYVGLGAMLAVGWTFLQLVPLPCAVLSADRADYARALSALGALRDPLCTISLAPGSTRTALARLSIEAALMLCAMGLARARQRSLLQLGLALSSLLMACVALAHASSGAESVFGIYTPKSAKPGLLLAPLLNGNHLAGHLALGLPLCLSRALDAERVDERIGWAVASFIVFLAGLFSLSRAGAAALLLGGAGCILLYLASNRRRVARRWNSRSIMVLGALLAVSAILVADALIAQFSDSGSASDKIALIRSFAGAIADHPILGVGRGAFGDVSALYLQGNRQARWPENILVQWGSEWGVPVTLALFAALAGSLSSLRLRRRANWALALGVFAISAQNLFDFGLELAGLGSVASVALGTLLAEESPRGWLVRVPRPALRIGLVSAVGVAALALLLAVPTLTYASREGLIERLGQQRNVKDAQFAELLSRALALYPRDARVIEAGTRRAVASNAPNAARWLNLALRTTPSRPTPHTLAAWYLERRGRLDQAALELALAVDADRSAEAAGCAFVQRHPVPQLAWSLSPVEPAKQRASIEYLARCMSAAGHQVSMVQLLTELIARDPGARDAYLALIQHALQSQQIERALVLQEQMQRNLPVGPETVAATVHTLVQAGKPDVALRAYDEAPPTLRLTPQVMGSAAAAAAALKQVDRLEALYTELIAQAPNAAAAADTQHMASVHLEQAGAIPAALAHAQAAYELNGDPQRLERVYELATRAGFAQVALRASLGLCHLSVRGKYYCQHAP